MSNEQLIDRPLRWLLIVRFVAALGVAFAVSVCRPATPTAAAASSGSGFSAPLVPMQVLRAFAPPAQPWLAGNRGVDLAAHPGQPVHAAAAGTVLYAGMLAGRGVVSITHATLRTTYEPVVPAVRTGEAVARDDVIGYVASTADTCGSPGRCLHWGAIRAGDYVDPMGLLATAQVRLLPIWGSSAQVGGAADSPWQPLAVTPATEPPASATTSAMAAARAAPSDDDPTAARIGWTATASAAGGAMLVFAMRRRRGPPG